MTRRSPTFDALPRPSGHERSRGASLPLEYRLRTGLPMAWMRIKDRGCGDSLESYNYSGTVIMPPILTITCTGMPTAPKRLIIPRISTKTWWPRKVSKPSRMARRFTRVCLESAPPWRGTFVTDSAQQTPFYVFTAWSQAGLGGKRLGDGDVYAERLLAETVPSKVVVRGHTLQVLPRRDTKRWIKGYAVWWRSVKRCRSEFSIVTYAVKERE